MSLEQEIQNRQATLPLRTYSLVAVIGVGGIGSWVAFNLALSGKVKKLIIVDADVVESTNLNRTPFRIADIGQYKVDALKYIILERRCTDVLSFRSKTNSFINPQITNEFVINTGLTAIIDCRDDIYTDLHHINTKHYKLGYDGSELTIDGNPVTTKVWGAANGYRVTPSFICPSQLIANLVVTDLLMERDDSNIKENNADYDYAGRLNGIITFDSKELLSKIFESQKGVS